MADDNDIGGRVGLDTTDFKAGVADLNRQIRVIDSGFRAAASGMDDWGHSEEGLNARISSLNQIVELQRRKVAGLTEQYNQVAAAQGAGSRAAQDLQVRINNETAALNRSLRALDTNTNALNNLGQESTQTAGNIDNLADSSDDAGKSLGDMGGIVAAGVVAGIAAIGAAAVGAVVGIFKFSNDTTKALNDIQAKTGYSKESMEGMKDTMLSIYNNNFGESLEDIANSMGTIGQQTGATGKKLQELTENAILLRDVFEFDVGDSTKAATMMMNQFGVEGKEAFNLIAQGAQWGLDKNGDLLDSINEYSTNFKMAGLSAEDMFNMFENGASAGVISSDKIGDAIKEFGIRSKDLSTGSADAFKVLGLNAEATFASFAKGGDSAKKSFELVNKKLFEMKDPLAQNTVGTALYGSMWEDVGAKGIKALTATNGEISNSTDALKDLNAVKYNDIGSALEGVKRKLITSFSVPLEKEITPRINDMIGALGKVDVTPIVAGLGWLIDNANNIAAGAISIGVGMATWNVVSMIQGVVKAIKAFKLANEGATIAQWALNAAQAANPVGIIVALIVGLIAGIIYLWKTNEGFRNAVIGAWNAIKKVVVDVVTAVIGFVKNNWKQMLLFLVNPFAGALALLYNLNPKFKIWVDNLINKIVTTFQNLPAIIGGFFVNIYNGFIQWGSSVITWVTTTIPQIINSIFNFFNELPGKLGYALGVAIGTVIKFGIDLVAWVIATIPKVINNIITFFTQLPGKVSTVFTNVLNKIIQWGTNVISWIATTIPRMISNIISFYASLPGKIATVFTNVLSKVVGWGSNVASWAKNTIPGIVTNVVGFFNALPGKMLDIGKNIVKGLWDGIKSMIGWLKDKVSDFAGGIVSGIKDKLGIHSPSRVMRDQVGLQIGAGMAVGINDSSKQVNRAMQGLNNQISANGEMNIDSNTQLNAKNNQRVSSKSQENTTGIANGDIVIPIYLNDEVMAKGIAKKSDIIQGKNLVFQGRMVGI